MSSVCRTDLVNLMEEGSADRMTEEPASGRVANLVEGSTRLEPPLGADRHPCHMPSRAKTLTRSMRSSSRSIRPDPVRNREAEGDSKSGVLVRIQYAAALNRSVSLGVVSYSESAL